MLYNLNLSTLAELKKRWKVSMRALIRRAKDLHCISENTYRAFQITFSKKGYNRIKADLIITTGDIPLQGCIDFFGNQCNLVVLGFSRLDYFYFNNKFEYAKSLFNTANYKKNLIWLPTFRKSNIKSISEEYLDNTETGLPLLETEEEFLRFNTFLSKVPSGIRPEKSR